MTDPIALASVLSSAAIAGGTLWANYLSGRQQRDHEAQQGFEGRVWEVKSSAIFATISAAVVLLDNLEEEDRARQAVVLSVTLHDLDEVLAQIEAYASEGCRSAFGEFRSKLVASTVPSSYSHTMDFYEDRWFKALRDDPLGETRQWSDRRDELQGRTLASMIWEPDKLRPLALDVIREARLSVRSSTR